MGDLQSVEAAVAEGASVNDKGIAPGYLNPILPLSTAVTSRRDAVVVWLLSHGADATGGGLVRDATCSGTVSALQLLLDAGADVNGASDERPPLCCAPNTKADHVRVLVTQPLFDFTRTYRGFTAVEYVCNHMWPAVSDIVVQEVRHCDGGEPYHWRRGGGGCHARCLHVPHLFDWYRPCSGSGLPGYWRCRVLVFVDTGKSEL